MSLVSLVPFKLHFWKFSERIEPKYHFSAVNYPGNLTCIILYKIQSTFFFYLHVFTEFRGFFCIELVLSSWLCCRSSNPWLILHRPLCNWGIQLGFDVFCKYCNLGERIVLKFGASLWVWWSLWFLHLCLALCSTILHSVNCNGSWRWCEVSQLEYMLVVCLCMYSSRRV